MKNISRHQGKLEVIRREKNSLNGNPRFLLRVAGFTCYTAPDSSLGYTVTNFDGKNVVANIGTHYGRTTLNGLESIK